MLLGINPSIVTGGEEGEAQLSSLDAFGLVFESAIVKYNLSSDMFVNTIKQTRKAKRVISQIKSLIQDTMEQKFNPKTEDCFQL